VLTINKEAAKSCLGWEGIDNRMLVAYFRTQMSSVSVTVLYAPVELTDGISSDSDEFYLQLQEQFEGVPGRNTLYFRGI